MTPMEARRFAVPRWARLLIAIALVLLLLIAAVLIYRWYEADEVAAPVPEVVVTATELARAYDQDPVGADIRYDNRTLRVAGTLAGVSSGAGDPVIILGGSDPLLTVTATLSKEDADRLTAITPGQPVTVTCGSVALIVDAPALNECTLGRRS